MASPDQTDGYSYVVPSNLIERLADIAVSVAHDAADMIALSRDLPLPDWVEEIYAIELAGEIDAVLYSWPHLKQEDLRHLRSIVEIAFQRRLARHATAAYQQGFA